jgi:hypothetical protein
LTLPGDHADGSRAQAKNRLDGRWIAQTRAAGAASCGETPRCSPSATPAPRPTRIEDFVMIDRKLKLIPLAVLAALAVVACERSEQDWKDAKRAAAKAVEEVKEKAKDAGETTTQIVEDTAVTARVRTALLAEKDVKSSDIAVETFQGKVILSGTVPDRGQLDLAAKVARSVEGVKAVDNRLAVK